MTPYRFGQKIASQPSMLGDYAHQLNKFYNPWSDAWNEPATDNIEKGLQYAGRGAMGLAAAAGLTAGGIAAAPAITGAANTAQAAVGAAGTAAATQGQRVMDAANRTAPGVMNFANKTMDTLNKINYSPMDVAQDVYAAGTGNFDKIKGPGGAIKGPSLPAGAPSFPRPLQIAKNILQFGNDASRYVANAGVNMLPHSPTN